MVITPDCGSGDPGSIPSTHPINIRCYEAEETSREWLFSPCLLDTKWCEQSSSKWSLRNSLIYWVQTRWWLSHYEGKLRGSTSARRDRSRAICLSSSYVWSERWSEKPEVCWFDSDLRHQAPSVRKFIAHRWRVIRQAIWRRVSSMGRKHLVVRLSENLKEW